MGYFLIYENMLPSVLQVRDRYLKSEGIIIPRRVELYIALFSKEEIALDLNLSTADLKKASKARIEICNQNRVMSNPCTIFGIDLKTENFNGVIYETRFAL